MTRAIDAAATHGVALRHPHERRPFLGRFLFAVFCFDIRRSPLDTQNACRCWSYTVNVTGAC